jgi:hypothetical protein
MKETFTTSRLGLAMPTIAIVLWLLSIGMVLVACASKAPIHPGSINAFDSQAADDLLLVQTALCGPNSTTTTCPGGLNAEAKAHPSLLQSLQVATRSYNTAEALYEAWVKAAKSSTSTASPANVQQAISQAKADTATAQRTLAGGTQ